MRKTALVTIFILMPVIVYGEVLFTRDLYFGMGNDPEVARLQDFLRDRGYFTYSVSTGNYLTMTVEAVMKFQKAEGIETVGGYFGPQSREAANRLLAKKKISPPPVSTVSSFSRNLSYGLTGNPDVVRLQELLRKLGYFTYPVSTGHYFDLTRDAVKKFQVAYGVLPADGAFGTTSRSVANQILSGQIAAPGIAGGSATTSPYKGKIKISGFSGSGSNPGSESVTLENRTREENITVSGWVIENSGKERFWVPKGHELPGFSATAEDPITLKPGERVIITAGKQNRLLDFKINLCTGYFMEQGQFSPSLPQRCPRPDVSKLTFLSDHCLQVIEKTPACRMVSSKEIIDGDCSQYVNAHLNYNGCVRDHRTRTDFYGRVWYVWMQRSAEFFRNVTEKVTLKDTEGKTVDERSY